MATRYERLRVGDIVCIRSLFVSMIGDFVDEVPMWAVVTEQYISATGDRTHIEVFFGPKDAWSEDELDDSDTWQRRTNVPDYVGVALAKWRLTGEKSEVRTS